MKKIMILAVMAVMGLAVNSCKCSNQQQVVEEEVVETVDSTAVDTIVVTEAAPVQE